MASLITVSDLVDRCAPPTEVQRTLWLRRARLWSVADILPTARPQGGARRHRLYSENIIFLAAVLLRISDFGTPAEILDELSKLLQAADKNNGLFDRKWRQAKRGDAVDPTYLSVTLPRPNHSSLLLSIAEGSLEELNLTDDDAPTMILNLLNVSYEVFAVAATEKRR